MHVFRQGVVEVFRREGGYHVTHSMPRFHRPIPAQRIMPFCECLVLEGLSDPGANGARRGTSSLGRDVALSAGHGRQDSFLND